MTRYIFTISLLFFACTPKTSLQNPQYPLKTGKEKKTISFEEKVQSLKKQDGLLVTYHDQKEAKIWLEVPPASPDGFIGEYLYVESLLQGVGSNPIGLDRGQLGRTRVVRFRQLGKKFIIEEPNLSFRAITENEAEKKATTESFATSVLWVGQIETSAEDGKSLVDLSSFLIRDAHNVSARLQQTNQGNFKLDTTMSAIDLASCLSFPDNLEFEALLSYRGSQAGNLLQATVPSDDSFSVVQHHSLIRLPDANYRPRKFDPRAGSFSIRFLDYAAPLDQTIEKRWIVRHRMQNGGEPLIYYVDPAIPEPILSAVLEGAAWWEKAFAAAGFPQKFRVEILPKGAHPLDVRYNVIQWVHRSTRGWSYGGGIVDPRTGEMIKGHVSLGSLRVRQDRLLFEGLLGTQKTGTGSKDDPIELALARIRQLAAHEVGHTLGLAHNFAASTYARASVMDYPAPLVMPTPEKTLDVSQVYGVGLGEWDLHAINWAYREFATPAEEKQGLESLIQAAKAKKLFFLSDQDARPSYAANPLANLWDNGSDPITQLSIEMEVRQIALQNFGAQNISTGTPLALLEEVLATVYFRHRYQVEAVVKFLGGVYYDYSLQDGTETKLQPVSKVEQKRALQTLLDTISPEALDIPESTLALLFPRPFGYGNNREQFVKNTSPVFDTLGAAASAAGLVLDGILQAERIARLVDFHRRDENLLSLEELLQTLRDTLFKTYREESKRKKEIRALVQWVFLQKLISLGSAENISFGARARIDQTLQTLKEIINKSKSTLYLDAFSQEINRYFSRPAPKAEVPKDVKNLPPGSPIGVWNMSIPTLQIACSLEGGFLE